MVKDTVDCLAHRVNRWRRRERRTGRGRQQALHVRLTIEYEKSNLRIQRRTNLSLRVLNSNCTAEGREAAVGDVVNEHRWVLHAHTISRIARQTNRTVTRSQPASYDRRQR